MTPHPNLLPQGEKELNGNQTLKVEQRVFIS
jgi:hypothetical protein